MTFTYDPIDDGSDGELQADGKVINTYWRKFLYKDDSLIRPTSLMIASNIGILPGSPFVDDPNATAVSFHLEHPFKTLPPHYMAHVTFKWATNGVLNASTSTDPTTRRTIWSVKPLIQQRFVDKYPVAGSFDSSGDPIEEPILNTAGQPYSGGVPVNVRLGQVTASRNVDATGYDSDVVMTYSGSVNSATYLGGPPGTVQVDVESHERYEGAYHFWEEFWTFTYDPQGHQPKPLSAGFFQIAPGSSSSSSSGTGLIPIQIDGANINEPEPLDADGAWVPPDNRPDDCVFVTVPYFPEIDFATFRL